MMSHKMWIAVWIATSIVMAKLLSWKPMSERDSEKPSKVWKVLRVVWIFVLVSFFARITVFVFSKH